MKIEVEREEINVGFFTKRETERKRERKKRKEQKETK